MPKRPSGIGTVWMGYNKKYLHGPRFTNPDTLKRMWVQGHEKRFPRYVMGETHAGKTVIQSILRPVYPGETPKLLKVMLWHKQEREYVLDGTIRPFATYDHKRYAVYSLALDRATLNSLCRRIKHTHNYRVRERQIGRNKIFVIYRTQKRGATNVRIRA